MGCVEIGGGATARVLLLPPGDSRYRTKLTQHSAFGSVLGCHDTPFGLGQWAVGSWQLSDYR